jgi:hypothetical protein
MAAWVRSESPSDVKTAFVAADIAEAASALPLIVATGPGAVIVTEYLNNVKLRILLHGNSSY